MDASTPDQMLRDNLERGVVSPAYLFVGEEEYLLSEAVATLANQLAPPESRDFNLTYLDGDKLNMQAFVDAARSFPLFSSTRLSVVRKAELIPPPIAEQLADELDFLAPGVVVAFSAAVSEKEAKLRKLSAKIASLGTVIRFPRFKEAEAASWLVRFAREKHGVEIPLGVAREIVANAGTDLRLLTTEVHKLCTFAGQEKRVSMDDAAQLVGRVPLASIFQLTDAVGKGDAAVALACLADLYSLGQPDSYLLHMLTWHFRNLLTVKGLLASGLKSPVEVAAKAGLSLYPARKAMGQCTLFAEKDLVEALALILAAGVRSRQQRLDSEVVMQTLLMRLCSKKEKSALT